MSKRKSVRFMDDEAPSDEALLRMSKRRRNDNGEDTEDNGAYGDIGRKLEPRPGEKSDVGKSKHTLDSDEEEDEKYDRLNVADVEGQEDATVEFDEETKITPFNMTEEMEEGHFDSDGTFIFKKKSEDIRDAWLDNIDWAKIKKDAGGLWQGGTGEAEPDPEASRSPGLIDRTAIYESILKYLQPQETITKAIKRLGGSRTTADIRKQRWRDKKSASKQVAPESDNTNEDGHGQDSSVSAESAPMAIDEQAQSVMTLTELVDSLVSEGEFEAYGYTYEKIKHELEKCRQQQTLFSEKVTPKDDSALDMFAAEIDEKTLTTKTATTSQGKPDQKEAEEDKSASDDVQWEFKWQNEDTAQVYGPYSTHQMQQWTDEGYFKDGVWVRRTGQANTPFYNSKRIDFELYV